MHSLHELGRAVAKRRRDLGLTQVDVARSAGVSSDTLSRFEVGRVTEFGARKLLAVLSTLGMEMEFREEGTAGSLDELQLEHRAARR
ncbi:helix-turn-helix domain-containing protein [Stenotrophomonas tumulicola]|uniref:Helix-turn-helix domain-containing protein n=1 Tax=Stenotrophomonas tumulicola TaxID=1685415 RepID=A0A7W3IIF4_9GAMM|nr:helix-turn-helix domain-containing protein [Stenotrophomonas tumulicola]